MISTWFRQLALVFAAALALAAVGCVTAPPSANAPSAGSQSESSNGGAVAPSSPAPAPKPVDSALAARILALDPENIAESDVRTTLALGPTPHIVLLHGGIYPVYLAMVSFGRFLTAMGYPENRIRHPGDRRWSHSPYEPSSQIAGMVAWYYERDGVRPFLIGHSQGGVQAVKILRDLAGSFDGAIAVWNPLTDAAEPRTTIIDPQTGAERPVVGLSVAYVSVVGAGGAALILPNQWNMIGHLHTIPDTTSAFTGYALGLDLIAWTSPGSAQFKNHGMASVRNVTLPASYNHVTIPVVGPLGAREEVRAWINAYRPDTERPEPLDTQGFALLWAADVWYDIKKHWTLEAQRALRAMSQRTTAGGAG